MGDQKECTFPRDLLYGLRERRLVQGVEMRSRLVEQQQIRSTKQRSSDRYPLSFPAGEQDAVLTHVIVEPLREP